MLPWRRKTGRFLTALIALSIFAHSALLVAWHRTGLGLVGLSLVEQPLDESVALRQRHLGREQHGVNDRLLALAHDVADANRVDLTHLVRHLAQLSVLRAHDCRGTIVYRGERQR